MTIFTPKAFAKLTADMIERVRASTDKVSDFNVGSIVRTLLEAGAVELDDYYQAVFDGLMRSIPEAIHVGFGFSTLPAVAASGYVRLTRTDHLDQELTVPAGSLLISTTGITFTTQSELVLAENETTGDVVALASVAGVVGNVAAETVSLVSGVFPNDVTATNPVRMAGGIDLETDDQRFERFSGYIASLSRATVSACEYAVMSVSLRNNEGIIYETVRRVAIDENAGHAYIYIYNGAGQTSDALIAAAQKVIDGYYDPFTQTSTPGYRPAGVYVDVRRMTETPVNIVCSVGLLPGYTASDAIHDAVRDALHNVIDTSKSGVTLPASRLITAGLSVPGISTFTLTTPPGSINCLANQALLPGTFTLTWI